MRRLMTKTVLAALILSGCSQVKQYPKATEHELWVRVELENGAEHKGALLDLTDDSLLVVEWEARKPDVKLALDDVATVRLHRGQLTSLEGALKRTAEETALGAAAGTAGGLLIGALFGEPGEGAKAGFGIGVASGLWGGMYSGIFEGEDQWEEVSLESLRTIYCALKRTPACGYLTPAET